MRETINFLTLRAFLEPESPTSNRYRVGIGWHGEPIDPMSVPDRKRAERMILDAAREEASTYLDDDPDNDDRDCLLDMVGSARSVAELQLIVTGQTYHEAR